MKNKQENLGIDILLEILETSNILKYENYNWKRVDNILTYEDNDENIITKYSNNTPEWVEITNDEAFNILKSHVLKNFTISITSKKTLGEYWMDYIK